MTRRNGDRPPAGGDEEAAGWVVRLASDQRTRGDERAFEAWLARDPANAERYADHALLWQGVGALADDDAARAILGHGRAEAEAPGPRFDRRLFLAGGAAVAAAASAAFFLLPAGGTRYETAPGGQQRITLADGSSVVLNTDSQLRVELGGRERRLYLDRGQAWFSVAKDSARPFRVFVGDDEVRAIGTAFEVRRVDDGARVILEEGVVALYRAGQPADRPAAVLRAGQQARLVAAAPVAVGEVDLRKTQAWRYGRLILDDAPLGETVADLNRYGGKRIVLADPALADLRVSGVFHTGRPEAFVEGVTAALPVRVAREDAATLVLEAR